MAKNTVRLDVCDTGMQKKLTGLKVGSVIYLRHKVKVTKVHDRNESDYQSPMVGETAPLKRMLTIEGELQSVEHDPARAGKLGKPDGAEASGSAAAKAVLAMD
jgi:spermidine synthase